MSTLVPFVLFFRPAGPTLHKKMRPLRGAGKTDQRHGADPMHRGRGVLLFRLCPAPPPNRTPAHLYSPSEQAGPAHPDDTPDQTDPAPWLWRGLARMSLEIRVNRGQDARA